MSEKAKVYFTDFRVHNYEDNLQSKLVRLLKAAGMDSIDFQDKFTAIKLHFGEPGNMAFLRPNWARTVADFVKERGGRPFLTDCNTLYVGGRKNALDHLDAAYQNGFNPLVTGCHVLIADGLKGADEVSVPVEGGVYVKQAKIGRAIMEADVFISLTHFKGHEQAGFGGAMKNIGMGCGSRAGKMEQHSAGKPGISKRLCVGCGTCEKWCAHDAVHVGADHKAVIDLNKCVGCGRCLTHCPRDAVYGRQNEAVDIFNCKMAEYTKAVVAGRPCFHISLAVDMSPECDCYGSNDTPIVQNIGMFASFDPVALDQACADAVMAQPPLPGSALTDGGHTCAHRDHFHDLHPDTHWQTCLDHAVELGLGTRDYELVTV